MSPSQNGSAQTATELSATTSTPQPVRNPQQHPPTRVGEKRTRGAYAHLSIAAKVAIGESASKNGNEFCISLSKDHPEVWGLGKPLPPSTVSDLKKNLPALRQEYEDGKPKRARGKHPRDVPDELVQAVVEYANEEGKSFGRTTTTAVSQKFAELGSGRKVSPKFLWTLRQKEAFSLMKQHPLGSLELDNEVELEAAVRSMWQYNHVLCVDHGVLPHNTILVRRETSGAGEARRPVDLAATGVRTCLRTDSWQGQSSLHGYPPLHRFGVQISSHCFVPWAESTAREGPGRLPGVGDFHADRHDEL